MEEMAFEENAELGTQCFHGIVSKYKLRQIADIQK